MFGHKSPWLGSGKYHAFGLNKAATTFPQQLTDFSPPVV